MIKRIIQIREQTGLSQEKFAERLGLSRNFINQVENGKKNISDRTISDICREFNINEEWLKKGTGEMNKQNDDIGNIISELLDKNHPLYDIIKGIMLTYQKLDIHSRSIIDRFIADSLYYQKTPEFKNHGSAVEEAEKAYIKSRSLSAQKTNASVSNIIAESKEKNNTSSITSNRFKYSG